MIKFVLKWVFRLVLLVVVLAIIAVLSLDHFLRVYMEHRIREETGMDAEIGRVSLGLVEPRFEVRDFKLFNPASYGGTLFLSIPEFHVEYDPLALRQSKLHVTLVRLNLGELDVVKNEAGQTNILNLGVDLPVSAKLAVAAAPAAAATVPKPPPPPDFHKQTGLSFEGIDVLNISVGTLKFIDLKDPSRNRSQNIDIENCVVKNVKSPADLAAFSLLLATRGGNFFESLLDDNSKTHSPSLLKMLF